MLIDLTFKKDSGVDLNQITVVLCTLYTLPACVNFVGLWHGGGGVTIHICIRHAYDVTS